MALKIAFRFLFGGQRHITKLYLYWIAFTYLPRVIIVFILYLFVSSLHYLGGLWYLGFLLVHERQMTARTDKKGAGERLVHSKLFLGPRGKRRANASRQFVRVL